MLYAVNVVNKDGYKTDEMLWQALDLFEKTKDEVNITNLLKYTPVSA